MGSFAQGSAWLDDGSTLTEGLHEFLSEIRDLECVHRRGLLAYPAGHRSSFVYVALTCLCMCVCVARQQRVAPHAVEGQPLRSTSPLSGDTASVDGGNGANTNLGGEPTTATSMPAPPPPPPPSAPAGAAPAGAAGAAAAPMAPPAAQGGPSQPAGAEPVAQQRPQQRQLPRSDSVQAALMARRPDIVARLEQRRAVPAKQRATSRRRTRKAKKRASGSSSGPSTGSGSSPDDRAGAGAGAGADAGAGASAASARGGESDSAGAMDPRARLASGQRAAVPPAEARRRTERNFRQLPEVVAAAEKEAAKQAWLQRQRMVKELDAVRGVACGGCGCVAVYPACTSRHACGRYCGAPEATC